MAVSKLQTLRAAAWLGWQIDANWTDLFVFATYTIIRPVFGMLTFAFMYFAASAAGPPSPEKLAYLLVGNSLFNYAANAIFSSFFAVHEDREHYAMTRSLSIAPSDFTLYYLGRIAAPLLFSSTISVIVNLGIGVFLLGVKLSPSLWTLASLAFYIPVIGLGFVGFALIIGGVGFFTSRYVWGLIDGITGLSLLLGGVLYPATVLPVQINWFSSFVPWTYWIELLRSAIVGNMADLSLTFQIVGIGFSLLFLGLGIYFFNWSVNRAKRLGTLDMVISW